MRAYPDLMAQHRQWIVSLPSDLPGLTRVRDFVRQAVTNSERWDKDAAGKASYLQSLIVGRIAAIGPMILGSATLKIEGCVVPDLPCIWRGNTQELVEAIGEMKAPKSRGQGLHTDEQRALAISLLLEIWADLEGV